MKVFVTGATGFIGTAVVRELIAAGHQVVGLARSDASAAALMAAGAGVQRGDIDNLDALRDGAVAADGVIHLAYFHEFTHASFATRLRVMLRGSPRGIARRFTTAAADADRRAIETFGAAFAGSDRPLIIAYGLFGLAEGRASTEQDRPLPSFPNPRRFSEQTALALATRGVRSASVRLAPTVHGKDDHGFMATLIKTARAKGVSAYVGDGSNCWPAVHRLDAAHLFRLALEKSPAGSVLHGVAEEGVPTRVIAEVIGRHLNLPAASIPPKEAVSHFGWLGTFFGAEAAASSTLTRQEMGWQPTQPGLIDDLEQGHYFNTQ